ncbi:type 4 prepilin peptidase 1 Aspartic peptidase. MEROPS family A24A [Polaromonas sp. YR568]|uniref:prepilin peptidase n=1 Tax=Polaromonas sp. YR568 TaxID=1855301 RepID=UPI0008E2679B|nr:A24 family peptidase [Polaromonas sp. YR568]SFU63865.1 type 4 prepilin peptidase 1 Aspartic peptidase. MEROPS family A24A [Polaromonas sp. YR568]
MGTGFGPAFDALLAGFFGLLFGSFLNVVIYRLPKMMERQWAQECAELTDTPQEPAEKFNLLVPRSRCSSCGHVIAWYENIPVASYLFLKGKCSVCGASYGLRYPVIEAVTGALFFFCVWRWGWSLTALAWCGFSAALLALAMIDWDTTLLPDDITLPLLWAGLIVAALQWNPAVNLSTALWGAVAGYLSLWLVYWAFKLATGKEGMGYGDFKLFAALGAWFGWPALVPIILMASVIGAVIGIALKFSSKLREGGYVPFGPFLAGAGFTAMIFGPQSILRFAGL